MDLKNMDGEDFKESMDKIEEAMADAGRDEDGKIVDEKSNANTKALNDNSKNLKELFGDLREEKVKG